MSIVLSVVICTVLLLLFTTGLLVHKGRAELAYAAKQAEKADALPTGRPRNPEMAHWYDEALAELNKLDPEAFEMLKYLRDPPAERQTVVRQITPLRGGYISVPNDVDTGALRKSLKGWKAGPYNTVILPEGATYQSVVDYVTQPAQWTDEMPCAHCGKDQTRHPLGGHTWQPRGNAKFVEGCHCQTCEDYRTSVIDAIMEDLDEMDRAEKKAKPTAAQKAQAELEKAKAEYEYEKKRRIELERQAASLRGASGTTAALRMERRLG